MEKQHVCPWWLGYTFLIPIRKWQHNPDKILRLYLKPGMTAMDYGCAMGYFSIPMAKMVGEQGIVYCVDIQEKMLAQLQKRAVKYGVSRIIKPLLIGKDFNADNLVGKLDFALLFMVVHEVPDKVALFANLFSMLKPGGKVLFFEPKGHVNAGAFKESLEIARNAGFYIMDEEPKRKDLSVMLEKQIK
jgi:ubiquinone/menaquinone biosynthesis C-methylase UbiE